MSTVIIDDSILASIGDAVRAKTGEETKYTLSEIPAAILSIEESEEAIAIAESLLDGSITAYSDTITYLGDNVFSGCTQLKEFYCPNITSIGVRTFNQCTSLEHINLDNITTVPGSAFTYCESLTDITLPNVTSIGPTAFVMCSALKKVDLHKTVHFYDGCFTGNNSMEALILRSTTSICTFDLRLFETTDYIPSSLYIYVPESMLSAYTAKNSGELWYYYASHFRAIEDYPEITGG